MNAAPKQKTDSWYNRRFWRDGLRPMILARDPVCTICKRVWSTVVDHIKPFRSFPTEQAQWDAFTDASNLRGICKSCHDTKTATFDGGFGHVPKEKPAGIEIEAAFGVKYVVSSLPPAVINAALARED